jgi:GAF domain-containing protein
VLVAVRSGSTPYCVGDVIQHSNLAGDCTSALESAWNEAESNRVQALERAFHGLTEGLLEREDPAARRKLVVEEVRRLFGGASAQLARWNRAARTLETMVSSPGGQASSLEDEQRIWRAFTLRRPVVSDQPAAGHGPARDRSIAAAPLRHEGHVVGAVAVAVDGSSRLSARDAEALQALVDLAARLLDRIERVQVHTLKLAGRELGDRINNDVAIGFGALELMLERLEVPPGLRELAEQALPRLESVGRYLALLENAQRMAVRKAPIGLELDLERVAGPIG